MKNLKNFELKNVNKKVTQFGLPPAPLDLRIAFISTYPPRKCGIATFSKDLATSINSLNSDHVVEIIALDDPASEKLDYPWEVSHRIRQDVWSDYKKVIDYLNNSTIDMVIIQHEYGIFGQDFGKNIVKLTRLLKKPYIVTLHTIQKNPTLKQKSIIQKITKTAAASVVMLPIAVDILRDVYGLPTKNIIPIHHGTPDVSFNGIEEVKDKLGYRGKIVMSSVNLISKWKGLEYAIKALPEVVKQFPNFIYLIVGQTHPVILAREGEKYRDKLKKLAIDLGVEANVRFINKYVTIEELVDYIKASDLYITPYEGLEQISSGSLAYAVAAGKICISTAYLYAQEVLSGGKGYLVPPKNPKKITESILYALTHPEESEKMRKKCYIQGRKMVWGRVGFDYIRLIDYLIDAAHHNHSYPTANLSYLEWMTDERGLLEHSNGNEKNYKEGYSVDDNARGLITAIKYGDKKLADKYIEFIASAEKDGLMHCDMDQDGEWFNKGVGDYLSPGLADWFGRAFWSVCFAFAFAPTVSLRRKAEELVSRWLPLCAQIKTIRTHAFILLGLVILNDLEWTKYKKKREQILYRSITTVKESFKKHNSHGWHWFESEITYDNPRVPYALLEVARSYDRIDLTNLGIEMLDFLLDETFDINQNHFRFIGCHGWYKKGEVKNLFDEQPIEAGSTVQACFAAYNLLGVNYYKEMAMKAFAWYHGENIARRSLYNTKKGSIYDGVVLNDGNITVNFNQGAESTLEYLLAYDCYVKLLEEVA